MNNTMDLLPDIKLRLAVSHPSLEECYLAGYEEGFSGALESHNPFQGKSPEFHEWEEGWWAGFYGDAPLYQSAENPSKNKEPIKGATNDAVFTTLKWNVLFTYLLKYLGIVLASVFLGYQLLEMVA